MRLFELMRFVTWAELRPALIGIYPVSGEKIQQFKEAYESILHVKPAASETCLSFEPLIHPNGIAELRLVAIGGVAAKDPCFGLAMTPWNEWLGMEIDLPVLDGMPRAEIIAHCLIEMTHLGFEDRVVSKKMVAVQKPRFRRPWLSCFKYARGDDQIWRKLEFLDDDQDQ